MKNILYRFIEVQTHFGMSRDATLSLASMDRDRLPFIQSKYCLQHAPQVIRQDSHCMQNNQWGIRGDQVPTKSPIELRENSNAGVKCR
jgi:hypothetical protein